MYNCANCAYLNKAVKQWNDTKYCYTYPCESHGRTCGWCLTDKDLNTMGCSNFCDKKATPIYKAYKKLQDQDWDSIVLYRLGDFYEVMGRNARKVAEFLDLTLTGRDCGLPERVEMCGFPYHCTEEYINKLSNAGFKVVMGELKSPEPSPIITKPTTPSKPEQLSLFDLI